MSHSGDLAVIGFALGCEVGIDVEQLRDVGHLEQIARRFFHPSETSAVLSTPESARNLAFLRCWTGKEAILKALGTGIVGNLADFQVPIGDDWQGWVECSASLRTDDDRGVGSNNSRPATITSRQSRASKANALVRSYTFAM